MRNRWIILFVLFFARTTMAMQFQSVAALSPLMIESMALTLVDIGLLIGLYLGPGVIVAIAGGTLASWFGDRRVGIISIAFMVVGSLIIANAQGFNGLLLGRIVAGVGGVVVNVLMTKMVIDWFNGASLSTALGIFISSWPLGIALGLLVFPAIAETGGIGLAWTVLVAITSVALLLFVLIYREPDGAEPAGPIKVTSVPWTPLVLAALVWGLYNTAFAMLFGFGPIIFAERGMDAAAAGTATSLYMLTATVAIPLGGWLSDKLRARNKLITLSLVSGALIFPLLLFVPLSVTLVVLAVGGFVIGLCAGIIVGLPSFVLPASSRAFGMGAFYSLYYVLMMAAPPFAGAVAQWINDPASALWLGAGMMLTALTSFWLFCRVEARAHAAIATS